MSNHNARMGPGLAWEETVSDVDSIHRAIELPDPFPVLRVIAPGSPVLLAGEIRATVVAVAVRDGPHINYQVVWWSGLDRNEVWVCAAEVTASDGAGEMKLGF
jgi:hypothetical protein